MVKVYLLLVIVVAIVHGQSPALRALLKKLKGIQEETAKVGTENQSLNAELQTIKTKIDKRTRQYESGISSIKNSTDRLLKELKELTFKIKVLEYEKDFKNSSLRYLLGVNAYVEFSILLAKEDVQLLEYRRESGEEAQCLRGMTYKFDISPHIGVQFKTASNGLFKMSLLEDTVEIKVVTAEIEAATSELFSATEEKKRLLKAIEAAKHLLNLDEASLRADIEKRFEALVYTEETKYELESVVDRIKKTIKELDRAISAEEAREKNIAADWHKIQKVIHRDFHDGYICYQHRPQDTETVLKEEEEHIPIIPPANNDQKSE